MHSYQISSLLNFARWIRDLTQWNSLIIRNGNGIKREKKISSNKKKNGILFYISRTICNDCATFIGSARTLFRRRIQNTCVFHISAVKCPERVKSSDQTMSNNKKRRRKKTERKTKQTHQEFWNRKGTDTNYKIVCFIELSLSKLHPIVNNKTIWTWNVTRQINNFS